MQAAKRLRPGALFAIETDGTIVHYEDAEGRPKPTADEINEELSALRRDNLKVYVNAVRERRSYGPITLSTGHQIDAGPSSRANISGKVLALQAGTASGPVNWRMADDVTYEIAETDFIAIAGEIADWIERLYAFSWSLKSQVDSGDITSTDQIDGADWPVS